VPVLTVRDRAAILSGLGTSASRVSRDPLRERDLLAVSRGEGFTGSIRNLVVLVAVAPVSIVGGATGTHDELELIGCCIHGALSSAPGRFRAEFIIRFVLDVNISLAR
jgi:hypothetical protein